VSIGADLGVRRRKAVAFFAGTLLLLAACGGESAQPGGTQPADGGSGDQAVESVALILPGRADDEGYSQVGATGLEALASERGLETEVAESVDVAQQVEVFRDLASQGFDLVIGWGGQWEDGASEVAPEFPDTYFGVVNGLGGNGSNFASIDFAGEQWTFVVGYVMAKVSESGRIGVIAGPCFDSSARQAHGVRDGALHANPDLDVTITGLDSFDDPAGAKEATLAMIDEGIDVIESNLNTGNLGVFEAAQESEGVLITTEFVDWSGDFPEVALTASTRDPGQLIGVLVDAVEEDTWDGEAIRVELTAEDDALAPFRDLAPESLYEEAKGVQEAIASGEIDVQADGDCPYEGA